MPGRQSQNWANASSSHQMETPADSVGTRNDNTEFQIQEKYKSWQGIQSFEALGCNQKYTFHCYLFT